MRSRKDCCRGKQLIVLILHVCVCVCVSLLALVIRRADHVFSAPCYIVNCGLFGSIMCFHIIS